MGVVGKHLVSGNMASHVWCNIDCKRSCFSFPRLLAQLFVWHCIFYFAAGCVTAGMSSEVSEPEGLRQAASSVNAIIDEYTPQTDDGNQGQLKSRADKTCKIIIRLRCSLHRAHQRQAYGGSPSEQVGYGSRPSGCACSH